MSGEISIGNLNKKEEKLNKAGGINTNRAIFNTGESEEKSDNPYAVPMRPERAYMPRVDELANKGPLMDTRIHTQNSYDIAFETKMKEEQAEKEKADEANVHSETKQEGIRARSDLKVFSGDVMKNGMFTEEAKEASRYFFRQLTNWAGSFEDGGNGFYGSMGIKGLADCLYVDGMNLRNYLKEQYYYKTTGKPAQDDEMLRNYIALLAARGNHTITLVRPNLKGDEAEVQYKNLYVDLSSVGAEEASLSRKNREKGEQVRNSLKKRMDREMTERTGRAYRKAYGCSSDGFARIEGAKEGLKGAANMKDPEYKAFMESFENYNGGLQKLGLKPGRDDINLAVAKKLKERCEEALKDARAYLRSDDKSKDGERAVEKAKKELETDLKLLTDSINTKLAEEGARMRLDELLDSGRDADRGDNNADNAAGGDFNNAGNADGDLAADD